MCHILVAFYTTAFKFLKNHKQSTAIISDTDEHSVDIHFPKNYHLSGLLSSKDDCCHNNRNVVNYFVVFVGGEKKSFDPTKFGICHSKPRCLVTKFPQRRKEHLMGPRIPNFPLLKRLLPSQDGL